MAKFMQEREEDAGDIGTTSAGRWLLTYSDMITLLLILFVILFALSTISPKKFTAFKEGLRDSALAGINPISPGETGLLKNNNLLSHPGTFTAALNAVANAGNPTSQITGTVQGQAQSQQLQSALTAALAAKGLAQTTSVTVERRGIVVQILADNVYFNVDSAQLGPQGTPIIDTVESILAPLTNDVQVEGYTDNQPIYGGPYADNWALSAARAVEVVRRLISDGIDENRLSAIGYGETRPAVPNTSPQNQAQNRRIDIVVLTPAAEAAAGPGSPVTSGGSQGGNSNTSNGSSSGSAG